MEKTELEKHLNNVAVAVDKFVGTNLENINLQIAMDAIKKELFKTDEAPKESTIDDTNTSVG